MQIIHDFGVTPVEYSNRRENNDFPFIDSCPMCNAKGTLKKHGFYSRYVLSFKKELQIAIRRFKCSCCKKTLSVLPSFLLPHYQHTVGFILGCLRGHFILGKLKTYYQKVQFYRRRFLKNLKAVEMFFRDQGSKEQIPEPDQDHKAAENDQEMRRRFHGRIGFFPKVLQSFSSQLYGTLILLFLRG